MNDHSTGLSERKNVLPKVHSPFSPFPPVKNVIILSIAFLVFSKNVRLTACPMCLSGRSLTISAQELSYAQRSVLALPDPDSDGLRVVEVIKGDVAPASVIPAKLFRGDTGALKQDQPLLLIRDTSWIWWVNFGTVGTNEAPWLRRLAATKRTTEMDETERLDFARFLLPALEVSEPMVAEIAHAEIASAPYSVMVLLKPDLDAAKFRTWLADPRLESRRAAYTLLLGIAGENADAAELERRIHREWLANGTANLAPMLAADLELRGPSRVAWIEEKYFRDPKRTGPEIDVAVLALSEHGNANHAVPRERVVESFRLLVREHPSRAGLVAKPLADWDRWEFADTFETLLRSNTDLTTETRRELTEYLKRRPNHSPAEARAK